MVRGRHARNLSLPKVASSKELAVSPIYGERITFAATTYRSDKVGLPPNNGRAVEELQERQYARKAPIAELLQCTIDSMFSVAECS
jgi:hypothetical protein